MTNIFQPIYIQNANPNRPIKNYYIFGERHSGTNWLERLISIRLNLPQVYYLGDNVSKHFIRFLNWGDIVESKETLFICITRNIYDWIHGFYKLPHHVKSDICYNIENFLISEWNNEPRDNDYFSLKPYSNIFEMRQSKLFFYYDILSLLADNLLIIRYEDLMQDPENIITTISETFNYSKTNNPYSRIILPKIKHPYKIKKSTRETINRMTNWDTEKIFKYEIIS